MSLQGSIGEARSEARSTRPTGQLEASVNETVHQTSMLGASTNRLSGLIDRLRGNAPTPTAGVSGNPGGLDKREPPILERHSRANAMLNEYNAMLNSLVDELSNLI